MDLEYALDKKVEQDLYVFVDVDIWLIPYIYIYFYPILSLHVLTPNV